MMCARSGAAWDTQSAAFHNYEFYETMMSGKVFFYFFFEIFLYGPDRYIYIHICKIEMIGNILFFWGRGVFFSIYEQRVGQFNLRWDDQGLLYIPPPTTQIRKGGFFFSS